MATREGARNTVIAAVIGLSAGFLAVTLVLVVLFVFALDARSWVSDAYKTTAILWQFVPNLCLGCLLGFSVWVQAWTRGLRYSWLRCTLSSLAGACATALLGYVLIWILPKPHGAGLFATDSLLPLLAGTAGDFGGIGLYVGLRERRVWWFFLSSLGIGAALSVACWLLSNYAAGAIYTIFLIPLAPIVYFTVFHVVLDLLWRGGSTSTEGGLAAPSRGLIWARAAMLAVFVGGPALAGVVSISTVPLPSETCQ